ncbi:hypothetical protein DFJ73DRAFT_524391 [Zopfochytrium polystomum]|nr:hypothetical protein DFJ73DRAFT_524391 [Zopfochytrium polystomum]
MGPTATTRTTTRTALLRLAAALAGTVNAACARALALRPPLPPTLLHRGEAAAALQTRALSVAVLPAAHPAAGAAGRPKCSVITSAAEPLQSVRLASTNSDFVETASIGGTISSPAANPANGDVANAEKKRRTPQRLATMKFFYMKTMLETRKNVKGAKKQLQKMEAEGIPINSSHLSLIAAFYAREGKWRQALEWFTAVHRRGIPWQCLAATTVMSECAERNEWDKVEQLFQHFLSTGALPDEALLDSMIGIAANQGDFIRATFWYFRFAEFNLRPPHRVYKSRILSLLSPGRHNGGKPDSRDVETAVKILDEIEAVDWSRDGVDEVSWCLPYVHIMRAHSRMKHLDRVQEVFERCCKQWPDRNPPALLHEALITALAAGGDWEFARARLDSVASRSHSDDPKRNQLRPKVYAQFLEKAASDEEERRYVEAATRAAAVLQSEQLDEILVPSLIIGRLARGDTKGAKRLFIEKQPPKVDPVDQWELSLDGKGPKGMLFDVWDSSKVLFACKQLTPPALAVSEATAWFELLSERDPTLKSNVHSGRGLSALLPKHRQNP